MKTQTAILVQAQEILLETKDKDFYQEHEDYIEEIYAKLDEGHKVEFKDFMLNLYRIRNNEVRHKVEMQSKLENVKEYLKQSTETSFPEFLVKHSDFIDTVYEEFRFPGEADYLKEFGKFLEELYEESQSRPRIKVMRIKHKQPPLDEEKNEERKKEQANEFLNKVKTWLSNAENNEEMFDKQYHEYKEAAKGLDAEVRHQFYILVDQNRAEERRRRMQQRCERPRKLYAGDIEGRYHFFGCCKEINKRSHYEWTSCLTCFAETEEVLDLAKSTSSSSSDRHFKDSTIEFELRGTKFHTPMCPVTRAIPEGDEDIKSMCQVCVKEEKILAEARRKNREYYLQA